MRPARFVAVNAWKRVFDFVRSPAFVASVVAALLALVPAIIRLYESIAERLASPSLYLAWLLLWIVTASGLLWTAFGKEGPRRTRLAIGVCGVGMLLAVVMTVSAVSDPNTPVPAVLASLAHASTAVGAAACGWMMREQGRLPQISWLLAVVGASLLAIAAALLVDQTQTPSAFAQLALPGGTFLLGAGLSLGLGQLGETLSATARPTPSQET